jgi:hypothetical protein
MHRLSNRAQATLFLAFALGTGASLPSAPVAKEGRRAPELSVVKWYNTAGRRTVKVRVDEELPGWIHRSNRPRSAHDRFR